MHEPMTSTCIQAPSSLLLLLIFLRGLLLRILLFLLLLLIRSHFDSSLSQQPWSAISLRGIWRPELIV